MVRIGRQRRGEFHLYFFIFFVAVALAEPDSERSPGEERKRCQVFPFARGGLSRVN